MILYYSGKNKQEIPTNFKNASQFCKWLDKVTKHATY
jgi:hypothetical protein